MKQKMILVVFLVFLSCNTVFSYCVPPFSTLWKGTSHPPLPFWIPLGFKNNLKNHSKYWIHGEPFLLYKDNQGEWILIYDKCPHQSASLSFGGFQKNTSEIICPYHGFRLKDSYVMDPLSKKQSDVHVPRLPLYQDSLFLYASPVYSILPLPSYLPPEDTDPSFTKISGQCHIPQRSNIITENVLDMLHISYIHSFGNRDIPLPEEVRFRRLSNDSGVTFFQYHSGINSISRQVAKQECIQVENEYHLPSTTVTRVRAGTLIKTVLTKCLPLNEKESIVYWVVYRNFWNATPLEQWIFDYYLRILMEKTLWEDRTILKEIYTDHEGKYRTKYDVTIQQFRKSQKKYIG